MEAIRYGASAANLVRKNRKATKEEKEGLSDDRTAQTEGLNVEDARRICPSANDIKWVDQFPYVPSYRFYPYRSVTGATCSLLLGFIFFLRVVSSTMDFIDLPPVVTESRDQFPRDSSEQYSLPRVGVQFRENGWKPFNDPRYMQITFDQGVIQKSGNITRAGVYTELGAKECAFVDKDGRLIADDARCPRSTGYMQGDFHDVTFAFVRARLARCDNGTDVEGKPLPGMCMPPADIDAVIYEGVLYLFEQEDRTHATGRAPAMAHRVRLQRAPWARRGGTWLLGRLLPKDDMRVDSNEPFMRIRQWRREFVTGTHNSWFQADSDLFDDRAPWRSLAGLKARSTHTCP